MREQDIEDIKEFVRARDAALEAGDLEWVRRQLPIGTLETVALWTMHKARYEAVNVSREKRLESAAFMRANNVRRMGGAPLLPEGQLPE